MQQVQDQLSAMPAFMAMKLIGGAFRGTIPALITTATVGVGGLVYGAVKAGQGINKQIQKTKPGNNKGHKLLRDLLNNLIRKVIKVNLSKPYDLNNDYRIISNLEKLSAIEKFDIKTKKELDLVLAKENQIKRLYGSDKAHRVQRNL